VAVAAPARTPAPVFGRLACAGNSFCTAIGEFGQPGHRQTPVLAEWNGRQWHAIPNPPGLLFPNSVTCTRSDFCLAGTAVKGVPARTVEWNGKRRSTFQQLAFDAGRLGWLRRA
jgi:hypothetical protein